MMIPLKAITGRKHVAKWTVRQLRGSGQHDLVASITNLLGEPSTWRHELGSNWKYTEADRRVFSVLQILVPPD